MRRVGCGGLSAGVLAMAAVWSGAGWGLGRACGQPVAGEVGASRVFLHGGDEAGEAVGVSSAGVRVRDGVSEYVIGWDRIARVEGALAGEASGFEGLAGEAWRARTRLERGDAVAAEPLYEELFERLGETDGPTALSICEGLLRCRLWRGAHALALGPWLNWVRLAGEEAGEARAGSMGDSRRRVWAMALLPVLDERTGLVTSLPPVWLSGPSVRGLVAGATPMLGEGAEGPGIEKARALGALYLHAARYEGGDRRAAPVIEEGLGRDEGVGLVRDIVLARAGDAGQREAGRAGLRARLAGELAGWEEAWCRVGLGRSLLVEGDEGSVMAGVVELMHLPARFGDEQPYLTGVALAESVVALTRLGMDEEAGTLERLLGQRYAGHPAMEWSDLPRHVVVPARVVPAARGEELPGDAGENEGAEPGVGPR